MGEYPNIKSWYEVGYVGSIFPIILWDENLVNFNIPKIKEEI